MIIFVNEKSGKRAELIFSKEVINIGRSSKNDVILSKNNVSKNHARIEVVEGRIILTDLGSTNGTYLNGRKITEPVFVNEHDEIRISDFTINVRLQELDETAASTIQEAFERASRLPYEDSDYTNGQGQAADVLPAAETRAGVEEDSIHEADTLKLSPSEWQTKFLSELYNRITSILFPHGVVQPEEIEGEEFKRRAKEIIGKVVNEYVSCEPLPHELDSAAISRKLESELLGLGPVDNILRSEGDETAVIYPEGQILVYTYGARQSFPDSFISKESRDFIIKRLMSRAEGTAGLPPPVVSGRWGQEASFTIFTKDVSPEGEILVIEKDSFRGCLKGLSLWELADRGVVSNGMAKFIVHCMNKRMAIVVIDPLLWSHGLFIPSAIETLPEGERIVVVESAGEGGISAGSSTVVARFTLPAGGFTSNLQQEDFIRALFSIVPTMIVAGNLPGQLLMTITGICKASGACMLATMKTFSERVAIRHLSKAVEGGNTGESSGIISDYFDFLVTYSKMIDMKERVTAIKEILYSEEKGVEIIPIFEFDPGGGYGVGRFYATGIVPSFIREMQERGEDVDLSIFRQ